AAAREALRLVGHRERFVLNAQRAELLKLTSREAQGLKRKGLGGAQETDRPRIPPDDGGTWRRPRLPLPAERPASACRCAQARRHDKATDRWAPATTTAFFAEGVGALVMIVFVMMR